MKEHFLKFKEWWASLGLREKKAISLATVILSIFIVYEFIWQPLYDKTFTLRQQISTNEKTLTWMQNANQEIQKRSKQFKPHEKISSPVVMLGLLQKEIDNAGLQQYLTQLKQSNNDSIEMHFQKVQFDELVKLLTQVTQQHGGEIIQMSAIAESSPGIVNADILIKVS